MTSLLPPLPPMNCACIQTRPMDLVSCVRDVFDQFLQFTREFARLTPDYALFVAPSQSCPDSQYSEGFACVDKIHAGLICSVGITALTTDGDVHGSLLSGQGHGMLMIQARLDVARAH